MKISDKIIHMISESKKAAAPVTISSDLYIDLGYDSLTFINLLLEIEKTFSIQFELIEMGLCIKTGQLITLVEQKLKEIEPAYD